MSKKAFNTDVTDQAKSDRYFLTKHFHSAQSTEAERKAFVQMVFFPLAGEYHAFLFSGAASGVP
jgi:hypothetical protein